MKKFVLLFLIPLLFISCEQNKSVEETVEEPVEESTEETITNDIEIVESPFITETSDTNEGFPEDFLPLRSSVWNPNNINTGMNTMPDSVIQTISLQLFDREDEDCYGLFSTYSISIQKDETVNNNPSRREITFYVNGRGKYTLDYIEVNTLKSHTIQKYFYYTIKQSGKYIIMNCYNYPNPDFTKKPDICSIDINYSESYFTFGDGRYYLFD